MPWLPEPNMFQFNALVTVTTSGVAGLVTLGCGTKVVVTGGGGGGGATDVGPGGATGGATGIAEGEGAGEGAAAGPD